MFDKAQTEVIIMFANLESFSIFFFACLALIVLAIAFEDKLVALEKKSEAKRRRAKSVRKVTSPARATQKSKGAYNNVRRAAPQKRQTNIAA